MELPLLPFPRRLSLAAAGQGWSSLPAKQRGRENASGSAGCAACWALLPLGAAWLDCSGAIKTCN